MSWRATDAGWAQAAALAGLLCWMATPAPAAEPDATPDRNSVAVLDFELYDLTGLPPTPEELARTRSLRPLVEQALTARGIDTALGPTAEAKASADRGFGYLYDHPEAAAELGRTTGADWVLVGRLHKPSFLFAYLIARLVDSRTGHAMPDLVVEAKGQTQLVTERGAERLADQVARAVDQAPQTAAASGASPSAARPKDR